MSDSIYRKMTIDTKQDISESGNYLSVTVISRLPAGMSKLVEQARDLATKSGMAMRHGALLFGQSGKQVFAASENTHGSKVCGYDVPGQHAEANCLRSIFHQTAAKRRRYQTGIPRAKVWREKVWWGLWNKA
jgi:hypothetical protein